MTVNAFLFAWDQLGIESIIPITEYEHWDKQNLMRILKEEETVRNPLDSIVRNLILRARVNTQRHYEIYAVDCSPELDVEFWREQWQEHPQFTANLIRERGHKLYSDRETRSEIKIV
jgi:hypothetical protein